MSKKGNVKKKKRRLSKFCFWTVNLMIFFSLLCLLFLFLLNIIPENYFYIVAGVILFLDLFFLLGVYIKNKFRVLFYFLSIIYMLICLIVSIYEGYTYIFLKKVTGEETAIEKYQVVVLKNSGYKDINDLEDKKIGLLDINDDGYNLALEKLSGELSFNEHKLNNSMELVDNLLDEKIDAFLIDSVTNTVLKEHDEEFSNKTSVLFEFDVTVNIKNILKKRNVSKESFNIFISGIDSYGNIKNSSRSDVNILLSVNPKTKKVLITHIPRDYYVTLGGYKSKDKLTHAGIHGIDCSVKSVEALLDIDVNYYVKLNFTSLIDIVDAIGGVEVDSMYTFTTGIYDEEMKHTYTFTKGKNTLNGDQALAFVRERKAFNNGDIVRGENQMLVLEAIIKKCMQPSILGNYTKFLSSLDGALVTNMSNDELTSLVKMQLKDNSKWSFESFSLRGTNSYEFTYSYPKQKLYVMVPNDSLNEDKTKINELLNDN